MLALYTAWKDLHHPWQQSFGQVDRGCDVQVDDLQLVRQIGLQEGAALPDAGVQRGRRYRPPGGRYGTVQALHALPGGQIGPDGLHACALGDQRRRG
ncbi:hypothetical protein GCM10010343_13250 [Streptomyces avidinii]|nr:hypothetical protein GCM10010343_13250 [Streptomyces avidinii]